MGMASKPMSLATTPGLDQTTRSPRTQFDLDHSGAAWQMWRGGAERQTERRRSWSLRKEERYMASLPSREKRGWQWLSASRAHITIFSFFSSLIIIGHLSSPFIIRSFFSIPLSPHLDRPPIQSLLPFPVIAADLHVSLPTHTHQIGSTSLYLLLNYSLTNCF